MTLLGAQFLDNPHPTPPPRRNWREFAPGYRLAARPSTSGKIDIEEAPNGGGEHWVAGLYRVLRLSTSSRAFPYVEHAWSLGSVVGLTPDQLERQPSGSRTRKPTAFGPWNSSCCTTMTAWKG